jgi:hypothetical protein
LSVKLIKSTLFKNSVNNHPSNFISDTTNNPHN